MEYGGVKLKSKSTSYWMVNSEVLKVRGGYHYCWCAGNISQCGQRGTSEVCFYWNWGRLVESRSMTGE